MAARFRCVLLGFSQPTAPSDLAGIRRAAVGSVGSGAVASLLPQKLEWRLAPWRGTERTGFTLATGAWRAYGVTSLGGPFGHAGQEHDRWKELSDE
jgi:hypothetical protein